jgi:threonine synthase
MILDAVRASGGRAMACPESAILPWMRRASALEGVGLCPESAACLGVLERALAQGHIRRDETIILFNTGAAQKYAEAMRTSLPRLEKEDVDWDLIAAAPPQA